MRNVSKKILLVDDEPDIVEVFRTFLSEHPFEISTVDGGREALDYVRNNPVDLVISDIRMPQGDGLQFLDDLQKYFQCPPRVLLVSGYAEVTESEVLGRGALMYLKKPVEEKELISAVFKCLGLNLP